MTEKKQPRVKGKIDLSGATDTEAGTSGKALLRLNSAPPSLRKDLESENSCSSGSLISVISGNSH